MSVLGVLKVASWLVAGDLQGANSEDNQRLTRFCQLMFKYLSWLLVRLS